MAAEERLELAEPLEPLDALEDDDALKQTDWADELEQEIHELTLELENMREEAEDSELESRRDSANNHRLQQEVKRHRLLQLKAERTSKVRFERQGPPT